MIDNRTNAFLADFFSPPNSLAATSKPELAHWIARIDRPEPLSTVLPCWRAGKSVDWYGIAFDDRQLRALGESLTAFIGPSYTTFHGQIAQFDPADPIDRAVRDVTGGRTYRFRVDDPQVIWAVLERMRKVWERKGPRERAISPPVGSVLRDFHMAIRAGHEADAVAVLALLHEEYHLDAINLLFLRVELLASFRRWAALLDLPEMPDLLRLRRPVAVTEALIQAVYHHFLVAFESPTDAQGATDKFVRDVYPRYFALFAHHAGMRSSEALKCLMLAASVQSPPEIASHPAGRWQGCGQSVRRPAEPFSGNEWLSTSGPGGPRFRFRELGRLCRRLDEGPLWFAERDYTNRAMLVGATATGLFELPPSVPLQRHQ